MELKEIVDDEYYSIKDEHVDCRLDFIIPSLGMSRNSFWSGLLAKDARSYSFRSTLAWTIYFMMDCERRIWLSVYALLFCCHSYSTVLLQTKRRVSCRALLWVSLRIGILSFLMERKCVVMLAFCMEVLLRPLLTNSLGSWTVSSESTVLLDSWILAIARSFCVPVPC